MVCNRLKLSHATSEQVDRVQAAVRRVVARKAKLTAAHSDVLFGGYMGCGWRRWRDEVGIERVKIIAMAWEEWDTTFARVMRGAVAQMQEEHGRVPMVFQGAYVGGNERIAGTWLGQAWRWMSQVRLTMKLRGVSAVVSEADPLICSAFNTADDRARSRAACARFRVRRRSDMMCYDGEQVRPEAAVGGEWERADGGKWAGWACAARQRLVAEKMLPVAMPVPAVEVGATLAFRDMASGTVAWGCVVAQTGSRVRLRLLALARRSTRGGGTGQLGRRMALHREGGAVAQPHGFEKTEVNGKRGKYVCKLCAASARNSATTAASRR